MSQTPPAIRGIEHVGITVPDIEAAERFFVDAFGAETLYALVTPSDPPYTADTMHEVNGLLPGTAMISMRMMRLANGPNIELFELEDQGEGRRSAAGINDRGMHHFGLYVDDLDAAVEAFRKAGGVMTRGPVDMSGPEDGEGNRVWFGRFPWGSWIEFITFPSGVKSECESERWRPDTMT